MNIKDSVGKYLSYSEGDYYDDADSMDYDYDEEQDEQYEEAAPEKPARASKKNFFDSILSRATKGSSKRQREVEYDDDDYGYGYDDDGYYEQPAQKSSDNVVDFKTTSAPAAGGSKAHVVFKKVDSFADVGPVADVLNEKRIAILNLETCPTEEAVRVIDFLSGVAYANNATIQRVAGRAYIITPNNVPLSGELLDEVVNSATNGLF